MSTKLILKQPREYTTNRPGGAGSGTTWLRIGRGTRMDDGKIICTLESIPLNWDGVFYVFDVNKEEGE